MANPGRTGEAGTALLITLAALLLFSILGLYVALNSSTSVTIAGNFEAHVQATYAALAGLNHARTLLRGLELNDVLKGPDGTFSGDPTYQAQAKSFGFRSPLPPPASRFLNILNPLPDLPSTVDDGLISTGFFAGSNGTPLIPIAGIGLEVPGRSGTGSVMVSRYFVKVTDNNGQPSEVAGDPGDSPFSDGDGIVVVRSTGLAKTISETTGMTRRLNSVAVFESRLKRMSTFDIGPAVVLVGNDVNAVFDGSYEIAGDVFPGIGTIDTNPADSMHPDQVIRDAAGEEGNITGGGQPDPSVDDITGMIESDQDRRLILDPGYLWDFIHRKAPRIADSYFEGDQRWIGGDVPPLGSYDATTPWNAPGQDPKITVVNGDLQVNGGLSGGGILIVTGDLSLAGPCSWSGLVLVVGTGNADISGAGQGIEGELLIASLIDAGGRISFGTPGLSLGGNSRIAANRDAVRMAIGLIPASQISFREITGTDP